MVPANYAQAKEKSLTTVTPYEGGAIVLIDSYDTFGEVKSTKYDFTVEQLNAEMARREAAVAVAQEKVNELQSFINDLTAE